MVKVEDRGFLTVSTPELADIQLVTNGWSTGKVKRDFDRSKKVNGTRYYKVASEDVITALEKFNEDDAWEQFTKNNAYVKSISFQEINYLLNKL